MAAVGSKVRIGGCQSVSHTGRSLFVHQLSLQLCPRTTVSGPFCCEFHGGVGLVDFSYEAVQTFSSMIPKGEHVINVSPPYCWLFSGTG